MQIFPFPIFCNFVNTHLLCVFFFHFLRYFHFFVIVSVISFEPIKIENLSAPENDRLNLSFMEDILAVEKQINKKGRKMAIYQSCKFW